ncbi:branched-chain amino acid ABC transporter permease [Desulforamulus hydrothermalis]|uniref:High-affinity branched-chain amino acid transport system permease protein BraD n=1 Tax=Desulforamulus hydrothermalis Lam5 = DSM 18033 TaxID=1121428 RepID=K8DXE1_9FIRM|nr:branched-chain amino acid ABC transporter permease [Desulforamulus hydrothermalis]CCO07170.1 High-affinity branched-chain amino acid transport system permease protein BraD [Desulforamulus hydrothermalis Lam5 = DSM 18033]SHG88586.1 amino acid/amide ABC transporter membrane protein 1, HAAT family [Desulforamulus hydrothermalis Lam5 = DSM 18033]
MEVFLQQLINGISLGSIYALIALGYTMVYGIVQLINFAHGDIYMVGAYLGFFATAVLGWSFVPALLLAMVVCAILGMVIEKLAYTPLRNAPRIAALITAIGVSLFLEYGMMLMVTPQVRTFPQVLPEVQYKLFGDLVITNRQIIILVVTVALMVLLQYIVHKTKIGKAMRAVSHDKQTAQLMGINVNKTISATFAIGSALAAAAGVLVGIYYNAINPLMGIMPGLKAFVAAVLGGIGIIPGAMTGGFLLGIVEAMVSGYGKSLYRDPVAFIILIIILIVKPAGLFGKNVREKV